ncbi:unnamed protein product [Callosobruchus maculatus]|uniref:Nucleolar protein 14 n=1 Tax=Callosobruchus maculatus TaxID=64391 RepID=A0A653C8R5_CALMS|nr:unnamed protein product [Callosobruchus maculatus]
MAKVKNKKRSSSDKAQANKERLNSKKNLNPFEVHINREKIRVIGQKRKNDRGLPGVSRGNAIEKRKRTLLQEYKIQNKSNLFMDKRIGERNGHLTEDDKVMARFTAVRIKAHNKKSIYNLADDEVLTHKGQTLSEIEKFDDPRSDDEDSLEGNDTGKLDKDFVEEAHFGGGVLKKTGREGATSHRDLINQLIAESKKRKAEKQQVKEATLELTEKLDTEWKDLIPLVNTSKCNDEEIPKQKINDYDKIMRELRFEARGTVSDRLKTEDEIAREEKEKLEQLEKERLERMKGIFTDKENKPTHRSADDLDDGILYEEVFDDCTLSYNKEGEANVQIDAVLNGKQIKIDNEDNENQKDDNVGDENSSDEDMETASEDSFADLKEQTSESEDEEAQNTEEVTEIEDELSKQPSLHNTSENRTHSEEKITNGIQESVSSEPQDHIKEDLLKRKEIMEQARKELPYTFSLPESYETLLKLLENQPSHHQGIIIERMIKCNHASLAEGNKENLGLLFAYLLQYINDLFSEATKDSIKSSCDILRAIFPQIYELAHLHKENAHNSILEVVKEKYDDYRKKKKSYPGVELLMFFRLISLLFSTSDLRHQVVTPCFIFIEQILLKCPPRDRGKLSYGFFATTLILQYTSLSKRYLPATINYLSGILHMAIPKSGVKLIKVSRPFKSTCSDLVLLENHSLDLCEDLKMNVTDLFCTRYDEQYKIRIFHNAVKALSEFHNNLEGLPSCCEIFEPVLRYLELIPLQNYPVIVQTIAQDLILTLQKQKENRQLRKIVREAERPKALRLYEPKIVEVYDVKRHRLQSKEKAERNKLLHKLRQEKKGALREIRRDKEFLGRVKIHQRIRSDKERRDKVNRIYAEAAMQQHELNAMDRKKRKK